MPKPLLCALLVWGSWLAAVNAQNLADPLDRPVAAGWAYKSFDEAVGQIEERTGFKVSCSKELAAFMRTIWMKQSTPGYPKPITTVRGFLDGLCTTISLKWSFDPQSSIVTVEPSWKTSDPRNPAELWRAVWQPGGGADYENDPQWQTALNALLSHPSNYERAWTVRQKSTFQQFRFLVERRSKPILMKQVIDTAGKKYLLLVTIQPIQMYPGHGSVSYYWFQGDGTLAGAGLMNTGHRCAVIDVAVANDFGSNIGKTSELQMNLRMNLEGRYLARFVLGGKGLELTHLVGARAEVTDPSGMSVGQNLMEPDPQ